MSRLADLHAKNRRARQRRATKARAEKLRVQVKSMTARTLAAGIQKAPKTRPRTLFRVVKPYPKRPRILGLRTQAPPHHYPPLGQAPFIPHPLPFVPIAPHPGQAPSSHPRPPAAPHGPPPTPDSMASFYTDRTVVQPPPCHTIPAPNATGAPHSSGPPASPRTTQAVLAWLHSGAHCGPPLHTAPPLGGEPSGQPQPHHAIPSSPPTPAPSLMDTRSSSAMLTEEDDRNSVLTMRSATPVPNTQRVQHQGGPPNPFLNRPPPLTLQDRYRVLQGFIQQLCGNLGNDLLQAALNDERFC